MTAFPRLKSFDFIYERYYTVPDKFNGRIDLIANEIYGDYRYYKAILAANPISMPMSFRTGVRPIKQALKNEVGNDENLYLNKLEAHRPSEYDWNDLGNTSEGYVGEVFTGRVLQLPSAESATRYMNIYSYLN